MSNNVNININFVTNGFTCGDILRTVSKYKSLSVLSNLGIENTIGKLAHDSFLSDLGLKQTTILSKNNAMNSIIDESDFIGTSFLSKSIETGLILFKNTNKIIYPMPFLGHKKTIFLSKNKQERKSFKALKKNFTQNDINTDYLNTFNINKNKEFWNKVIDETKKRKLSYNDKLSDLNWSLLNSALKKKMDLSMNIKQFEKILKKIIHNLLKKDSSLKVLNLTFITTPDFILSFLKHIRQNINELNTITKILPTSLFKVNAVYNKFNNNIEFENSNYMYPTPSNYNGLIFKHIDENFYFKFEGEEFPLQINDIKKDDLIIKIAERCPNFKYYKKILQKKN